MYTWMKEDCSSQLGCLKVQLIMMIAQVIA